jgi:uncharacterized membrane protein YgcG
MADVVIDAAGDSNSNIRSGQAGPVFISNSTGYFFYVNITADLAYRKTTNGGSSWDAEQTVKSGTVPAFAIWFDKWTPGQSGGVIHIAYVDIPDTSSIILNYKSLTTGADTLSSEVVILDTTATGTALTSSFRSGSADWAHCSITRAQGGNLYVSMGAHVEDAGGDTDVIVFYRSVDAGANWTVRTTPFEGGVLASDTTLLCPANTSDLQDIVTFYGDESANAVSIKMYDDSANTWTETAVANIGALSGLAWNVSMAVRHSDKHVLLAFLNGTQAATTDIRFIDLTVNSIAAPTVTSMTSVINDTDQMQVCSIFINQRNDHIYVAYLKGGTWTDTVNVYYKRSDDNATTWGSETQINEDAIEDHRTVHVGHSTPGTGSGRFYATWFDHDDNDWFGGFTNSIGFGGGGGGGGGQGSGGGGNSGGGGGGNPGGGPPGQGGGGPPGQGGGKGDRFFMSNLRRRRKQFVGF